MEKPQHLLNNQIRADKIVLLSEDGQKTTEMSFHAAIEQAHENDMDLVQFGSNKDTAFCKIIKYDSWLYHEKKKRHKLEVKNKTQELKSIQFRPGIGEHDFQVKMKKIHEFLQENHTVRIIIKLKSREFTMKALNDALIEKITLAVQESASVEGRVNYSPKEINFMLKPEKKAAPKPKM